LAFVNEANVEMIPDQLRNGISNWITVHGWLRGYYGVVAVSWLD